MSPKFLPVTSEFEIAVASVPFSRVASATQYICAAKIEQKMNTYDANDNAVRIFILLRIYIVESFTV